MVLFWKQHRDSLNCVNSTEALLCTLTRQHANTKKNLQPVFRKLETQTRGSV